MLQTLFFMPKPPSSCTRVLGVIVSQAPSTEAVSFSVPAHALLILNVVLHGTLTHEQQRLPSSFATGPHTRSRRYRISPGATLLTLYCRADAAVDLCGSAPAKLADLWLPAPDVFKAWRAPPASWATHLTAQKMLEGVSVQHLPLIADLGRLQAGQHIQLALRALGEHDLADVAARLHISERSLQRLFMTHWGHQPQAGVAHAACSAMSGALERPTKSDWQPGRASGASGFV